ncbi:hypothetical protein [Bradyrhizobium sp. LHD-71]|uniref:hypothetical protein n=1 Tax=Bradyrhizobium sp. LHD-71 TaxID=3072141 RepID=UPI00280D73C6|nr:hypothetical protein [Bradyrhizobium sp. LHD-71]MDQ8729827.1 hypothetical protein [Bradyrhizobium sp. LHD-71]
MRTLIHEVVAVIDDTAFEIVLIAHWAGGAHSELPKRRHGQCNSTSADIIEAVRQLVMIANDDLIAGILNRNGLKTGSGNRWTRQRVTSMRSNYRIPVFKRDEGGIEPWLNLGNAAKLLKVAPKTLRLAAEAGEKGQQMPSLSIVEFSRLHNVGSRVEPVAAQVADLSTLVTVQSVNIGAASTQSAVINSETRLVRLDADVDCVISYGEAPMPQRPGPSFACSQSGRILGANAGKEPAVKSAMSPPQLKGLEHATDRIPQEF